MCHNGDLVLRPGVLPRVVTDEVWEFLERRRGKVTGVVITGGEPALQLDETLVDACHALGFEVAVETNGTLPLPQGVDWVCVSPKAGTTIRQQHGDELKLVHPQPGLTPSSLEHLAFRHWLLQPMDGPELVHHTAACLAYCRRHPRWRLSVQLHKILGIP
jgi:organic radical activating enzyme